MITRTDGRIAYHVYQIREDGLWYVQYGFEGEVLWERRVREYRYPLTCVGTA